MTLSPTELDEIRRRCEAATPGPWRWYQLGSSAHLLSEATPSRRAVLSASSNNRTPYISECDRDGLLTRVDASRELSPSAQLIAHSRTDVPKLLAHIRELEGKLKVAEADFQTVADMTAAHDDSVVLHALVRTDDLSGLGGRLAAIKLFARQALAAIREGGK